MGGLTTLKLMGASGATRDGSIPQYSWMVLSSDEVKAWMESEQVGIYARVDVGPHETLDLLVEKNYV